MAAAEVPWRPGKGLASRRQLAIARLSAFLLLVLAGVLGTAQPAIATPRQQDLDYLNAAHQSNLTIIQAAQAAKTHGRSSCVRQVGALMERDHRGLAAQELEAASQLGVGLVPIPSLEQRQQLNALAAKAGTSGYDAAWLALQEQQHRQYLTLITNELAKGTQAAVKAIAKGAQPVVQMHLSMVHPKCNAGTESPTVPTGDGGQMANAQRIRSRTALILIGIGALLLLVGKPIRARRRLLGASALALGLVMVFKGPLGDTGDVPQSRPAAVEREAAIPPTRLILPGYMNAPVVPVATSSDGRLQVPKSPTTAGWWAAGAAPGSAGGTVLLAGHVDTAHQGRGVFAALWNVSVGTKITLTSGDESTHIYQIVARRTYRQEDLPKDLFRGAAKPRLALVTCTGPYDHKTHSYTHNLVLYGTPLV